LYPQDGKCDRRFRVFKLRSATRLLSQDLVHILQVWLSVLRRWTHAQLEGKMFLQVFSKT
jgi:hypothetical protein